ncbi:hypothetical protein U1Q18_047554 [Sarracenia purpurea var. burkii]
MMGKLVSISQSSSILLPQRQSLFHGSPGRAHPRFLRNRRELGSLSRAVCAQRHQKWAPRWTRTWVVSDSKAPTLIVESTGKEEIEIQADTSGGDGFGGPGDEGGRGGGGGGGGDSNNSNEAGGGSGESDNIKKMAMSMSQKLTLGYAALVGGRC